MKTSDASQQETDADTFDVETHFFSRWDTSSGVNRVNGIPTYIVFRDGKVVGRFAGAMPKEAFVQRILDALK